MVLPDIQKELQQVKPVANLQSMADQLLLQQFSPPAVLVNSSGDILYISGRTGKYLEPAAGKANWNIFAMAREGLRFELGSAFQQVLRQKGSITVKGLKLEGEENGQAVDITIRAIEEPEALQGMVMIVFNDVALPQKKKTGRSKAASNDSEKVMELEKELRQARELLQSTARRCSLPMKNWFQPMRSFSPPTRSCNPQMRS